MIYPCQNCDKVYNNTRSLHCHRKDQHEGKTYDCNLCTYSTTRKGTLTAHLKSVHFPKNYPCKICDYVANWKQSLSEHTKNAHQSERIDCIECNKSIKISYLKEHVLSRHSGPQTEYNCNICPFQTIYKRAVKRHAKTVHSKTKQ